MMPKYNAKYLFEQAIKRPADFNELSPKEQWAIDKSLGILDWEGDCEHQAEGMCEACQARYRNRSLIETRTRL